MRILLICPAPRGSRQGNRVTALRWARLLRALGHHVSLQAPSAPLAPADVLIALHARRSAAAVRRAKQRQPSRPIIVALTGTDVYHDLRRDRAAQRSVEIADRLVVLQPLAIRQLPRAQRHKARVIYQSVVPPRRRRTPGRRFFDICVLSHLRPVKDPLRTARASRRVPPSSRLRVRHAGRALTPALAAAAAAEMQHNLRYRWIGERSHAQAMYLLGRSHVLVLSSRLEGGANVIGEAAVRGVPVLASRIDGNVGLLGDDYPGYFPVGKTAALAALMVRAERDAHFYRALQRALRRAAAHFDARREKNAWRALLREVTADRR